MKTALAKSWQLCTTPTDALKNRKSHAELLHLSRLRHFFADSANILPFCQYIANQPIYCDSAYLLRSLNFAARIGWQVYCCFKKGGGETL